jgi:homoserine O-acetyltransferase
MVGRGAAIDTTRHRVLGFDWLAAATGPTTTADQAAGLARVLDHLQVPAVRAIVGASYGGMVALAFAAAYRERVGRLGILSAAHRSHPMATAQRVLQRRIVQLGLLAGVPATGVALARGLGITTYRSQGEFAERFATTPRWVAQAPRFEVEDYLEHGGRTFAAHFDPHRYLALSESLDLHCIDPTEITTPTAVFGVAEDQLVPLWQLRELRDQLAGPVTLLEVSSRFGHDAFLTEHRLVAEFLRGALESEVANVAH